MYRLPLLVYLVFTVTAFSQNFKYGKVSKEELLEVKHPVDSSAGATVLYKKGNSYLTIEGIKWILVTEVEARLKIYNTKGYGYAHVNVPFSQIDGVRESVVFYDAVTYNLSGKRIVKTKLDEKNQFVEDISSTEWIKKIILPDVKDGSVIEYKYIYKTQDISQIPEWAFQEKIPVNNIEYTVSIPRKLVYTRSFNQDSPIEVTEQLNERRIKLTYSTAVTAENQKIYKGKNIAALNEEEGIKPLNVSYQLVEEASGLTEVPKNRSLKWEDVGQTLYESKRFGGQLSEMSYFKDDLNEVLKDKVLKEERINAVYQFLRNRMSWDGWYSFSSGDDLEKIYKSKVGNVGEINLMLVSMLQYAGYNAYPVLLTTHKEVDISYPSIKAFNYVVAGVEFFDDIVLYDASSKNAVPGLLPLRASGDKGRMFKKDYSSIEIDLTPKIKSLENIAVFANVDQDGKVTGKIKTVYQDYNAFAYREVYEGIAKESHIREEYIGNKEKKLKSIAIQSFEISDFDDPLNPITEIFSFESDGLADVAGDKIYISPMLMYALLENPFKEDRRDMPVNFYYPYQDRYNINLTIPEGYRVDYIPEPLLISTADNIGNFKFNIAKGVKQVQILAEMNINTVSVVPEHYETLKQFFADLITKQTEKIVLVKK